MEGRNALGLGGRFVMFEPAVEVVDSGDGGPGSSPGSELGPDAPSLGRKFAPVDVDATPLVRDIEIPRGEAMSLVREGWLVVPSRGKGGEDMIAGRCG